MKKSKELHKKRKYIAIKLPIISDVIHFNNKDFRFKKLLDKLEKFYYSEYFSIYFPDYIIKAITDFNYRKNRTNKEILFDIETSIDLLHTALIKYTGVQPRYKPKTEECIKKTLHLYNIFYSIYSSSKPDDTDMLYQFVNWYNSKQEEEELTNFLKEI